MPVVKGKISNILDVGIELRKDPRCMPNAKAIRTGSRSAKAQTMTVMDDSQNRRSTLSVTLSEVKRPPGYSANGDGSQKPPVLRVTYISSRLLTVMAAVSSVTASVNNLTDNKYVTVEFRRRRSLKLSLCW
ncbi:hypothetical protein HHJ39_00085 [Escherichia coli]|nr:hypothetical protein HHJ39_00085 [Escherichia coli]